MTSDFYLRLLNIINSEREAFDILVNADNSLGLGPSSEEIINYLEFSYVYKTLNAPIVGNIIITEGDPLSILMILNDIVNYTGEYIIYINEENISINTYLIDRTNKLFQEYNLNLKLTLDYSKNYNKYCNSLVSIIGSEEFVKTAALDFNNANQIIV